MTDKTAAERIAEEWTPKAWPEDIGPLARDIQAAIDEAAEEERNYCDHEVIQAYLWLHPNLPVEPMLAALRAERAHRANKHAHDEPHSASEARRLSIQHDAEQGDNA